MRSWFYVIVETYDDFSGYRINLFGPFRTFEHAQEISDKVGPGEIVELDTRNQEEALDIIRRMYRDDNGGSP